jgi:hypothetical protein
MSIEQYRSKLFFEALNEGRTWFNLTNYSVYTLYKRQFIPHLITNPPSVFGKYCWDSSNNKKIIEEILELLTKEYQHFQEIKSHDSLIRSRWKNYSNANTDEWQVQNTIIESPFAGFKYLYDYDWHPVENHPEYGRNDIILTNGYGIFAVIETKVITGSNKTNKRSLVKRQANEYKEKFIQNHRNSQMVIAVVGVWVAKEEDGYQIGYSDVIDETIADVASRGIFILSFFSFILKFSVY